MVANLPYVREDEWDGLQPEIRRYEPREALVSGADGLDAIRALIAARPAGHAPGARARARPGGRVRALLDEAESYPDLAGWERVTVGRVP